MRKTCTFVPLALILLSSTLFAQWQWLNPQPEGNEFFDASFITPSKGWVVGGNGAILYTTDRGMSWSSQMDPLRTTPFICLSVVFIDENNGLISSNNGTLMRTSDGGAIWSIIPSPGVSIQKLRKAPDGTIWGFGSLGALAHTTDAGRSWSITSTNITDVVFDVAFPSASRIVAVCGGGIILASTDTGTTWTQKTLAVTSDIVSVDFVSATVGFAVQKSKFLLRTTDGGSTWTDTTIFVNTLRSVRFADSQRGWLISNSAGTFLRTTNGGISWTGVTIDSSSRYTFQHVVTFGPQEALFLGEGGALFYTANTGGSAVQQGSGITRAHLYSASGLSDSASWVFGERSAFYTSDGGKTWSANKGSAYPIHCGVALSATRIVAGGTQGEVYLSTNAGQTWTEQKLQTQGQIERIVFVDAQHGWLAGNHGTVARSSDGGVTWIFTDPGVTDDLHTVSAVSSQEAWVAGNSGKILHTTNAGASWQLQNTNTQSNLLAIHFVSPTVGYAGGQLVLFSTDDGGNTWTPRTFPGLDVIYGIRFQNAANGIILLSRGIARTTDGGQSFYRTDYPSTNQRDLSTLPSGHAWLVGDFGTIEHYSPAAAILMSPSTLDFGSVPINKQKDVDVLIQNTGERPMTISNVTVLGNGFSLIKVASNQLQPGQSTTATVRFAPPDTLVYRGITTVVSNALIGLSSIDLVGKGIPPLPSAIIHSPSIVDFGKVKLGSIRIKEVTIQNRSSFNLLIDDEKILGGDSLQYQIGRMSKLFIPSTIVDSIQVVFGPQKPGVFTSTLYIYSNDPGEPVYAIPLRGEAVNPEATITPAVVQFGYVLIDSTKGLPVTIRNTGTDTLRLFQGYTQNGDASEFSLGPVPTTPVLPGDSIVLLTYFTPRSYGPKSTTLVVESNDIVHPGSFGQLIGRATTLDIPGVRQASQDISLSQNYPNPVSVSSGHQTMYEFFLVAPGEIRLAMHDMLGREIVVLSEGGATAGHHTIAFDAGRLAPGQYPVQLTMISRNGRSVRRTVMTTVIR